MGFGKVMSACRKCGQPIGWGKNHNGKPIPLNADGTNHLDNCGTGAIKFQTGYSSKRGRWKVSVFNYPETVDKFCFAIAIGGGVMAFNEIPNQPYLQGCYSTPEAALEAGIKEVYEL